jgi:hypothetical protein
MVWWVFGGIAFAALLRRVVWRSVQPSPLVEKLS